jgi:hypothetical protein
LAVEVPGMHVKTLTCAAGLIQEMYMSQRAHLARQLEEKNKHVPKPLVLEEPDQAKRELAEKKKAEADKKAEDADIKGVVYTKAEWRGNGPKMPPVRSEHFFQQARAKKNREEIDFDDLLGQLYIDVNDPRNEHVIKFIQEHGNKHLKNMLREDARNNLNTVTPFRHKLLKARAQNPDLQIKFVPMLETELIDGKRTTVYLEALEKLYREEAYLKHLEDKARLQTTTGGPDTSKVEDSSFALVDYETKRRRHIIADRIKQRKRMQQVGGDVRTTSIYGSIVKEYKLPQIANPLAAIMQSLLSMERKLKPIVRAREPVDEKGHEALSINVHVIKGENVPVRHDIVTEFRSR